MGDISFFWEEEKNQPSTVDALNIYYEVANEPRTRLGLSAAGNECNRFLWYNHNGFIGGQPEGRVLRLFQLGNILEDQTILDLKSAGFSHYDCQKEVVFTQGEITLKGHIDGIVKGLLESPKTPHLFEHKTCSLKKYKELLNFQKKTGCTPWNATTWETSAYRRWNVVYYWQLQFYMVGLKLDRAAAFVYCKDDSRLYMERVKRDRKLTITKLQQIFAEIAGGIPDRSCPNSRFFKAKWCPFYKQCFNIEV